MDTLLNSQTIVFLMNYHVLITGGAGLVGSHLADALIKKGHRVRILDNLLISVHQGKKPEYINAQAEFITGDVLDKEILIRALEGIDIVFHESGELGIGRFAIHQVKHTC